MMGVNAPKKLTLVAFLFSTLLGFSVFATSVPSSFTYQGQLKNTSGNLVEDNSVDFTLQIRSSDGSCLLLEETHNIDMTGSSGLFSLRAGAGTRTGNDSGFSITQVFDNSQTLAHANLSCAGNSYTPSSGHFRKLRVTFNPGGAGAITLTPDHVIESVPYSTVAQTLQGKDPSSFAQITGSVTQVKLTNLTNGSDVANTIHHHNSHNDSRYVQIGSSLGSNASTTTSFGVGTSSPSTSLGFGGDAARSIGVERHSSAAGSSLSLQSGGAASGATDQNGGDLVVSSGTSTGTGTSKIEFKTAGAGSSGTGDNVPSTKMTITADGSVGIGTGSPASALHVKRDQNALIYAGVENADAGASASAGFVMSNGTDILSTYLTGTGASRIFVMNNGAPGGMFFDQNNAAGDIYFRTGSPVATKVTVQSGGNVGIGTAVPMEKLHVHGSDASVRMSIINETSTAARWPGVNLQNFQNGFLGAPTLNFLNAQGTFGSPAAMNTGELLGVISFYGRGATQNIQTGSIGAYSEEGFTDSAGGTSLRFSVAPIGSNSAAEQMRIMPDGKIGMGVAAPDGHLHVHSATAGTITANAAADEIVIEGTSDIGLSFLSGSAGNHIYFGSTQAGSSERSGRISYSHSGALGIDSMTFWSNDAEQMRIDSAGNVGIGETAPGEKLEVAGCIKHNNGTLGTACASDRRLKKNIEDLDYGDALGKVSKIQLKSYQYREGNQNRYLGVIAQELQEVAPELVDTRDDGFYTVNYEGIKWMTLQSVQQLNDRVMAENQRLREELADQEERLKRIEAALGLDQDSP